MNLGNHFLDHVTSYMIIPQTELMPAQAGLLFGNPLCSRQIASKAASLYHQGYFPMIIACGGVVTVDGEIEAHAMRDELMKRGVPECVIFIEDQSRHTEGNIINARKIAGGLGAYANSNDFSIVGVGQMKAARRFLMTMQRRWPEALAMQVSYNPYTTSPQAWFEDPKFKSDILKEYAKLPIYTRLGWIREVDLDDLNNSVGERRAAYEGQTGQNRDLTMGSSSQIKPLTCAHTG